MKGINSLTTRQTVAELDRYIIGQAAAAARKNIVGSAHRVFRSFVKGNRRTQPGHGLSERRNICMRRHCHTQGKRKPRR